MKILQINNCHYRRGGADVVYLNTGALLEKMGHQVFYFSQKSEKNIYNNFSDSWPDEINHRKVSVNKRIINGKYFFYNKFAYTKLLEFIEKVNPDLAHIHLFMGGLSVSILKALKEKNIPIVHTVHDYRLICPAYTLFDRYNKVCELCKDGNYIRCGFKNCALDGKLSSSFVLAIDAYVRKKLFDPLNYIDRFIFVSQFSFNKHLEFNNIYKNKSEILYNFSDIKLNVFENNEGYYLYFGRLSREKGLSNLVHVFNETTEKLKIVGEGPELNKLKIISLSHIEFLGSKNKIELKQLINKSKFIVIPSIMFENNPLSIVESFALGKPVIGSKIGGITELLENNRGILFDSGNNKSLFSAINNAKCISEKDYKTMCDNVKDFFSNNLSESIHYKNLINIYDKVLNV